MRNRTLVKQMKFGLVLGGCLTLLATHMTAHAAELPELDKAWDNRYIVTFKESSSDPGVEPKESAATSGSRASVNAPVSGERMAGAATSVKGKAMMRHARAMVESDGGEVRHELPGLNAVAVRMTKARLAKLAARSDVASIELDPPRYPFNTNTQVAPYGIPLVQSDQIAYGGAPGITVCVVDTGFDLGHPDLPSGVRVTGASTPGIGPWFNDDDGHGTHVAGSIMALANTEGVIGTTNGGDFSVHIYRVFDEEGSTASSSDVIAGVQSCADAGARVVNLSLGCTGQGCFSGAEQQAFNGFNNAGIMTVAAAGNEGADITNGTQPSYPAAYPAVIAVGAINEDLALAGFSQRYPQVEFTAPGVAVRSTVPRGTGFGAQVTIAQQNIASEAFLNSPTGDVSGQLVDCGLAGTTCANAQGRVCLIERGTFLFVEKAQSCQAGGGVGAIIYNNVSGPIGGGTLGANPGVTIPVAGISDTDGANLLNLLGQTAQVRVGAEDYGFLSGTSMATPHVSGVAALIWSRAPERTNVQIRAALQAGALDLGAPGRDNSFGFGVVQAQASFLALSGDADNDGVANESDNCPTVGNAGQVDTDADGIGDLCDIDVDGDGMSDEYETANGLNPLLADGLGDRDNDGFSNLSEFYASTSSTNASSTPQAPQQPQLVAAVLPSSRSAQVGQSVTAFATLINTSGTTGSNCSVAPLDPLPAGYEFYVTQAGTNEIVGAANTTVDIPANSPQSFLIRLTPTQQIASREVQLRFGCDNLGSAVVLDGLTTLLFSASSQPVADLIALAATASNDGVVQTNTTGAGAFSVASVNLGAAAALTASVSGTNATVPLALSICPTDLSGNCLQPAADTATLTVAANATPTFSVFVQAAELIAFDPANTRVRVVFTDSGGVVRGATSVAVVRNN